MSTAQDFRTGGLVLVVDDDRDIRETLGRCLEAADYRVELSADGVEALAAVALQRPFAILLDLLMPRMGGREFLRQLRAAGDCDAAILLMSSVPDIEATAAALGVGGSLRKPFSVTEMLAKLAALDAALH